MCIKINNLNYENEYIFILHPLIPELWWIWYLCFTSLDTWIMKMNMISLFTSWYLNYDEYDIFILHFLIPELWKWIWYLYFTSLDTWIMKMNMISLFTSLATWIMKMNMISLFYISRYLNYENECDIFILHLLIPELWKWMWYLYFTSW